jgi:hypothetical protein
VGDIKTWKNAYRILAEKMKRKYHLGNIDVNGRILLKWSLNL